MLQQTQVATVIPYFQRFMERFPHVATLAAADEADVLRHWEGLGYYRRARQLHRAAQEIVELHGGVFPRDPAQVLKLSGIGRYTAGAICSIAFDLPEPILEANTIRLFSRLLAYPDDPRRAAGQALLWKAAADWVPDRNAGAFNQALMELGSIVCTPRQPACQACPVQKLCGAYQAGLVEQIPQAAEKPRMVDAHEVALVARQRGKVLLIERAPGDRWAGLWDFPRVAIPGGAPSQLGGTDAEVRLRRELAERLPPLLDMRLTIHEHLLRVKHGVTRYRITLDVFTAQFVEPLVAAQAAGVRLDGAIDRDLCSLPAVRPQQLRWVRPAELAEYALPVTGRKIAEKLLI